jgi:hypothetical protein
MTMNDTTNQDTAATPARPALSAPARLVRRTVAAALPRADALAERWLAARLGAPSVQDLTARLAAEAYQRGSDRGFEQGLAVGCALGRHLEALRHGGEVARWRRLASWTALQRRAA